ncbi:MAG: hypothetical protein M1836_003021 [Candelina mexicana]|nr:MAG: hypothetical protein M1836_003021 [Candelina mexicana]
MNTTRLALRSTRSVRCRSSNLRQTRLNSSTSSNPQSINNNSHLGPGVIGGLAGGSLVFLAGYGYYHFSGAKTLINTAHQTKAQFESYTKQLKESAPEPNQALKWLRQTATSYAQFIPGGRGYVDTAFDDLDTISKKHGGEVDRIVQNAYSELKGISQEGGMNFETAQKSWDVLQKYLQQISELAADSASEIINNHPTLKKQVGGNLDQLKRLGDQYGPEAKKQVDETWDQIRDIMKSGVSVTTVNKIRSLVQEKMEKVKAMGDEAWKKGMEQAKPYLDKSPKVKQLIENNMDALKQGNVKELYEKVKKSAETGSTEDVENYINSTVNQVKQSSGGGGMLEQYLQMIPGGDKIVPNLSKLQSIAQEHGDEAEKLVNDAFKEVQQVLQKKVDEAQKLAEKASKK